MEKLKLELPMFVISPQDMNLQTIEYKINEIVDWINTHKDENRLEKSKR
jgi:hypothetical protein